uniref:transcription elongation factor A protein 1-like n=1 Tax=Styela clava TaxID=7725 RepID=UPI00193AB215|nr:transcription elongation factor A protein 1-like [Styela clava]
MSYEEEVLRIGRKLDNMVSKNTTEQAVDVLKALKQIPMTLDTLQKTRIGMSVNNVRKQTSSEEVSSAAKQLIKGWKKLVPEPPLKKSESSKSLKNESKKETKRDESSSGQGVKESATAKVSSNGMEVHQSLASTNNPVRDKCREMLIRGLETPSSSESEKSRFRFLAAMIEEAIFKEFCDTGVKYKNRVRSRYSNLKDTRNPQLRENVLSGAISPEKLAKMTPDEMASSEMKSLREKFEEENIKDHQMAVQEGTKTDMFVCGRCKGRACTYNQLQTRSADEPMTTFVFCMECGNRWKFC